MKRRTSLACAAALLALLSGCTKRVDTSSWESTKTSLEEMSKSLPKEEVPRFNDSLGVLVAKSFGPSNEDTPEARARLQQYVGGKTADEIIAEGERVKQQSQQAK